MSKSIWSLLLIIGLFYPIHLGAQVEPTGSMVEVPETSDSIPSEGVKASAMDTNYIAPNKYNLSFMLEHSTMFEHYRLANNTGGNQQSINFRPTLGTKLGIYFGWRWIFLGYTFDIKDLFGGNEDKPKKTEMSLNLYSAKFGVDLYYRKTGSDFKIRTYEGFEQKDLFRDTHFDGLESQIKGLNAFWIFNNKRFSYRAAYSQSTNQIRSAGSFMLGLSYSQHRITFDQSKLPEDLQDKLSPELQFEKIKYSNFSVGFGYSYNWVFAKNWLSNFTLLPSIGLKKSSIDDRKFVNDNWTRNINFDLITRAGIVYNNSKYYFGASLALNTYDYRKRNLSVNNSFGSLRIYAGFNFWKRKEYRH